MLRSGRPARALSGASSRRRRAAAGPRAPVARLGEAPLRSTVAALSHHLDAASLFAERCGLLLLPHSRARDGARVRVLRAP